jgi:hypothetical protein
MQAYRVRLENLNKLDNAEAVGRRAAALIDSASNLIKTHGAQSGEAKLCAALYVSLLQPIVHIFFAMPTHAAVRAKVIFFHHRLVDTLNSDLLQSNALQPVLLKLLETARSDNIIPTIELVNQLITRCKVLISCQFSFQYFFLNVDFLSIFSPGRASASTEHLVSCGGTTHVCLFRRV